ncbi:DUF7312 domain-containing protein [Halorhabdus amylolytica]|uniref:DUF7312 domain-containing protein n=1 Tax=Halorhabdus amylolytica TaxID=2559573 RepID=UPI001B7D7DF1|nr:hypothetical protein [Halorhabdus amylolytica]
MSEDDEWSYDVGEIGDEDNAKQAGERPAGSPEQEDAVDEVEDDDGWRFSLEDLEEGEDGEDEEGWLDLSAEVEAGSPDLENVVFVLFGVALGVVVAIQLFL